MQVPVFLTRQVFVKFCAGRHTAIIRNSHIRDEAALLVQSGELVGMGVSGVGVAIACTVGVFVAVATRVSVKVGVTVSTEVRAPQAEVINTRKRKITSNFIPHDYLLFIFIDRGKQFHYIHKMMKKNIFQKEGVMSLGGEFAYNGGQVDHGATFYFSLPTSK